MMEFVKELHEARLTRGNNALKQLTFTDCCERLFLTMLILELLDKYPSFRGATREYARRSSLYDTFNSYRMNGTDLYNFAYFISGPDEAQEKLKDPGAAKALKQRITLPKMQLNGYLRARASGYAYRSAGELLMRLESSLAIRNTDYKAIRRNVVMYDRLSTLDKKKTVTRLLIASRAKLRTADIIDDLEKLAAVNDLETARVQDNEPKISVPDISTDARDISLYRYLVGVDNLMKTKNFLDLAKQGRSVPAQFVQGYTPAIKMVDDIVQAGPAYINLLRSLHQRAKKARK